MAEPSKDRDKAYGLMVAKLGRLQQSLEDLIAATVYVDNGYCSICKGHWPDEHRRDCVGLAATRTLEAS